MTAILNLARERDAHIDKRLRNDSIAWLNTVRPDGRPHSVAVWFLWEGETILVFSKPKNQKIFNLRQNSNVVLSIDDTHQGADPITIEGTAILLKPEEADTTLPAYVAKYGERIKRMGDTPETMAVAYSQGIRITPTRVS